MFGLTRNALAAALSVGALTLAACGGDDETTSTTSSTTATQTTVTETGDDFIDPSTGDSAGLAPDTRVAAELPPPETDDLEVAAESAGCELQLDLPDESVPDKSGSIHVAPSEPVTYDSVPPTSGNHDDVPTADGSYLDTPEDRNYVHSLEHGRVLIHYSPDLSEDEQLQLKGVLAEDPGGILLFPNPDMPYAVAATAWTNLIGCDTYTPETPDAIRAFIAEFRGQGPEDIPF